MYTNRKKTILMLKQNTSVFSSNNLKNIETKLWDYFQQGVKNKKSSFHYPTIASLNKSSLSLRTVILRKVIRDERSIFFYTDYRSKKIKELKVNNNIFMHIYDSKNKIQLQVEGKSKIFNKTNSNKEVWKELSSFARTAYLYKKPPGAIILGENDLKLDKEERGYKNFTIVKFEVNKIFWLFLDYNQNKKAVFLYKNKSFISNWLVP